MKILYGFLINAKAASLNWDTLLFYVHTLLLEISSVKDYIISVFFSTAFTSSLAKDEQKKDLFQYDKKKLVNTRKSM